MGWLVAFLKLASKTVTRTLPASDGGTLCDCGMSWYSLPNRGITRLYMTFRVVKLWCQSNVLTHPTSCFVTREAGRVSPKLWRYFIKQVSVSISKKLQRDLLFCKNLVSLVRVIISVVKAKEAVLHLFTSLVHHNPVHSMMSRNLACAATVECKRSISIYPNSGLRGIKQRQWHPV